MYLNVASDDLYQKIAQKLKLKSFNILRSVVDVCGGSRWYPPLLPGRMDPLLASNDIEMQLRTLTEQHREVNDIIIYIEGFLGGV